MPKQIEVEFIGELTKDKFGKLKELLEKEGESKEEKERISFMYFRESIPKDLKDIKDEKVDLRFRITNKKSEIVLKYGIFDAAHSRKEISIPLKKEDCEKYIEFLALLGWNIGVIYATRTFVYSYKGVEFSLVKIRDFGYNFEAEILTDENNIDNAKIKIKQELDTLQLKPFNEESLNRQCNSINNKKELQFDFSKQTFSEIKDRFKEFF